MSDDGAGMASTDRQAVGEQRTNERTNERASREQTTDGANLLSFAAVSEQQRSLFLPFFLDRPGRKRRLAAGGPEWLSARLQMGRCKLTWDMASSSFSCESVARQDGAQRRMYFGYLDFAGRDWGGWRAARDDKGCDAMGHGCDADGQE